MSLIRSSLRNSSWILVAIPLLFVALGLSIEHFNLFPDLRAHVGERTVPETLVRSGRTGRELRLLDYRSLAGISLEGFDTKVPQEEMPSTVNVRDIARQAKLPIVSIVVDSGDLLNRETGLIANFDQRGRAWERPAYFSYFREGELGIGTGTGLRVHGGKSRGMTAKSFRLHFRDLYGSKRVSRRLFFDGVNGSLASVVVHNDLRIRREGEETTDWHFANPIAYEIAERIGCITPATQPVQFYLNGVYQGPYVLTERITLDFLVARFGHGDFFLADTKSDDGTSTIKKGSSEELIGFVDWSLSVGAPISKSDVEERIDLENMTNWFISILYSGTTDAFQGMIAREKPAGRWFWINWDMDHSFMDWYKQVEFPWEIDTFSGRSAIGQQSRDPRGILFNRLRLESPEYRKYFLRRLVHVLNHELTPAFVQSVVKRYRHTAIEMNISDLSIFDSLNSYAEKRPAVLRQQMMEYFSSGPSYSLALEAPVGLSVSVDGRVIGDQYNGEYFSETPARIRVNNIPEGNIVIWYVNGVKSSTGNAELEVAFTEDTSIRVWLDRALP